MSDLAGVIYVESVALEVTSFTNYTALIQLDEMEIFIIPNVRRFVKKGEGEIVQFQQKIRLQFTLAAGYFVDLASYPQRDFVTVYRDMLNLSAVTLYPDSSKQASGDGFDVVPDLEDFRLERFRRGTRSQEWQLKFSTRKRLNPSVLSYFRRASSSV